MVTIGPEMRKYLTSYFSFHKQLSRLAVTHNLSHGLFVDVAI